MSYTLSNSVEHERACGMIKSSQNRSEDVDEDIVYDQLTVNAVQINIGYQHPSLLRKPGTTNGITDTILLECAAPTNLICPGLDSRDLSTQQVQSKMFNGSLSSLDEVETVE